jgi:hypothetical protein
VADTRAVMNINGEAAVRLIRVADQAMYAAKAAGRDRVAVAALSGGPTLATKSSGG